MSYINKMVDKIKKAKTDKEIKDVLLDVCFSTSMDSGIRKEFDEYWEDQKWVEHIVGNLQ